MHKSIDLFAGIGGIRRGFDNAFKDDIETTFVSEWDEPAQRTYKLNYPGAEIAGDITQIDEKDIPEFDICLAGFPCQAFSMAGKHGGFEDDYKGRCRGTLFQDVVRICDYHKPKVIFCENVKGLTIHDRGRTFKVIKGAFEEIGYTVFHQILNSKDFGVPQNRERIYLVCFRNDIAPKEFLFPEGGGSRAFEIPGSDTIMNELACTKISAPSTDKTDITMQIHDINTGYEPICGFSIKSELGSAPTLLNASGATNFVYEVSGISDELAEQINAIDSKTKILDRIQMITENGTMKYSHMKNKVFSGNLMLIDTYMEEIIAHLLLLYYQNQATDSDKLIRIIEEQNPLGYPRKGIYAYKFKKFLCSIALGMMPSKEWDGHDEANGGYVIVKDNGEVLAYHIYNRDAFEKYLLNNTKFERGSTGKHGFATLYMENGKRYINSNLYN